MNNSKELSSETLLLNPISPDVIDETEEQEISVYDTNLIIVDNYGYIKVIVFFF